MGVIAVASVGLLLAAVDVDPGNAAGSGDFGAARTMPLAKLSFDLDPADAHVYVTSSTGRDVGVCTGGCTLRLEPGAYSVAAGLRHAQTVFATDVRLASGDDLQLHLAIEDRSALRISAGVLMVGSLAFTAVLAGWQAAVAGPDLTGRPPTQVRTAWLITAPASFALGVLLHYWSESPTVKSRSWSVPVE